MRVTTLFNSIIDLPGVWVRSVDGGRDGDIVVDAALRRRRLICSERGCRYSSSSRYDVRPRPTMWRHLDYGRRRVYIRMRLRRIACPFHGVTVEAVPFARARSGFTADFESNVAWLATATDKTAVARLSRIAWRTVGAIVERVVADEMASDRLDGLKTIGVDEVSWRKHRNYLTVVVDHDAGKVVWTGEGFSQATLERFFDELGRGRSAELEAVSMDMGWAYRRAVMERAPQATICYDPFHVVALVTEALEEVRRQMWRDLRRLPGPQWARAAKDARWPLLKNPEDLDDRQRATLDRVRRSGSRLWRAYLLKEAFSAVFGEDVDRAAADDLLAAWSSWAQEIADPRVRSREPHDP